jgi:hypothetical protein
MSKDKEFRIESAWRAALERKQPSRGFAERVEARIRQQARTDAQLAGWRLHTSNAWFRIAAAAVLLLAMVIPLGLNLHHQAEVAKGEAARQQVLLALRITGTQLRTIQHHTQFINASPLEGESQ